jgi:hypothetical protein
VVSLTAFLLMGGCLERTSEEVQAIDPRFIALPENTSSAGLLGVQESLLDKMEGPRLDWALVFQGEDGLPIDVDVRTEQGKNLGKWMLPGPGETTQSIPANLGPIQIQAFQDLTADGPTDDDPFGWLDVEVGESAPENTVVKLERGGKLNHAQTMGHVGTGSAVEGRSIQIQITIQSKADKAIDLDFRSSEGLVYKAMLPGPGAHSISVPVNLGVVQIQAFQDLSGDGPSDDDPFGWIEASILEADLKQIQLSLEAGAKIKLASVMGHGAVALSEQSQPFSDFQGEWTLVRGEVRSKASGPLQVDFRVPDLQWPGGNRFLGRSMLPETGAYQLQVPKDYGALILEVFQDLDSDGPTDDDPYALLELSVGDVEVLSQDIELVAGARAQPGAVSSQKQETMATAQHSLFSDLGKDPVRISGTLSLAEGVGVVEFIDLDLFAPDTSAPGGRRYLGKLKFKSGPFSFQVPKGFGPLDLEAFGDLGSDGPTPGDPFGRYVGPALDIESEPYVGVDIVLSPS